VRLYNVNVQLIQAAVLLVASCRFDGLIFLHLFFIIPNHSDVRL